MDLRSRISPIGFGAFKIGRNEGIKYVQGYPLPDDASAERLLNGVLDLGITYIDTAPAYGTSEVRIGRFLSHRRSEFVLSTKVGESFDNATSRYDFSKPGLESSMEASLQRLRTDAVDVLFLHAPRDDWEVLTQSDAVSVLLAARQKGLARAVGFSGYTMRAFAAALNWADVLMLEYHPQDRTLEPILSDAAAANAIVVVKKPLGSGRIPAGQAIGFGLANKAVTSLVIGSQSLEHMTENLRIARQIRGAIETQ